MIGKLDGHGTSHAGGVAVKSVYSKQDVLRARKAAESAPQDLTQNDSAAQATNTTAEAPKERHDRSAREEDANADSHRQDHADEADDSPRSSAPLPVTEQATTQFSIRSDHKVNMEFD